MAPIRSNAGARRRYSNRCRIDPIPPRIPPSLATENDALIPLSARFPVRSKRWCKRDLVAASDKQPVVDQQVVKRPTDPKLADNEPIGDQPSVRQAAAGQQSTEQLPVKQPAAKLTAPEQPAEEQHAEGQPIEEQQTHIQPFNEQLTEESVATGVAAEVQSLKKRSTEAWSSQVQPSRKRRAHARPVEARPANRRPTEKQPVAQREETTAEPLQNYGQAQLQQLQGFSDRPQARQPSATPFVFGRKARSKPPFIQSTTTSFYEGRLPLQNPETTDRQRRRRPRPTENAEFNQRRVAQNSSTTQHLSGNEREAGYALQRSFPSPGFGPVRSCPEWKREGYGFDYNDTPWQSFESGIDDTVEGAETGPEQRSPPGPTPAATEYERPYQVAGLKASSPPRAAPGRAVEENQSPFLTSTLQSPSPTRPSIHETVSSQPNWSFSSTASTIGDDFNDLVVIRDVGSFHVTKPQKVLPCTVATREDTIRLKAKAKLLFDKYAESADVQTALLFRLERMVLAAQEQVKKSKEDMPTLLSCALKIRDFLVRTEHDRVETGELRRVVVHEIDWAKWLVEACSTGVMHMRTGECKCRPEWEA
ncbi:hypothetical protein J1614_005033 [Plenodomus biglobosus]|nr:hypothetical protein J1614_005033 [Plenodomus biglobosus]